MIPFSDERRTWAIESTIADEENVGQIIANAADIIMAQLGKDGLIGRRTYVRLWLKIISD